MIRQFFTRYADSILMGGIVIVGVILNLQFLDASNINYALAGHDEYIAVREVYTILKPLSYKHFFMAIISGDVLYYGRIMFYTDAIFAYLPFKIFGLHGMVYAIRMAHVIFILSGLIILSNTFLNGRMYRVIFYLGTATLYYSAYFFMVPKPEPLQLLFLAIFFYYFKKHNYSFGKFFIFLGLAYGIKFNILTVLPFIVLIPFFNRGFSFRQDIKKLLISGIAFLSGILIAVPCLLLAPVKPVFLKSYYNATFGSTTHYDDDATLNAMDWIVKGWFGAYNGGIFFGVILVILIAVILYFTISELIKTRLLSMGAIMLLTGLFLFIPVIIFTGRLWPHYLWTGYIFIFLGIVIFIEQEKIKNTVKVFSSVLLLIILIGSLKCSYAQGIKLFTLQADSGHIQENGKMAYTYLRGKSRKLTVVQEISVPYPFEEMLKAKPYHPFASVWNDTLNQKFIWQSFITPDILKVNNADYLLTNRLDFEGSGDAVITTKDSTLSINNALIRNELGKTIFYDTAFGSIKVYKVITVNP